MLSPSVPGSLAFAVLSQVAGCHKGLQVFLDGVAVRSRDLDDLADRQSSVLSRKLQNPQRELRQGLDKDFLARNLGFQPRFLCLQSA